MFIIPILIVLAIAFFPSFFLSKILRRRLIKTGNKYAKTISVLTFIGGFLLIFTAIVLIISYNLRFER